MNVYDMIRRPVISEKNSLLIEQGQYTFEVASSANKHQVRAAVEEIFGVTVVKVNTINVKPKPKARRVRTKEGLRRIPGSTAHRKKAIVTLAPGQRIEIFDS